MVILKIGQRDTGRRSFICTQCGCEFVYTNEDIGTIIDEIGGFFSRRQGLNVLAVVKLSTRIILINIRLVSKKLILHLQYTTKKHMQVIWI